MRNHRQTLLYFREKRKSKSEHAAHIFATPQHLSRFSSITSVGPASRSSIPRQQFTNRKGN